MSNKIEYQGVMTRAIAQVIDNVVLFASLGLFHFVVFGTWIRHIPDVATFVATDPICLSFLAVYFIYFIVLEGTVGATVGKLVCKIRVMIKKCPLITYFILSFIITWSLAILAIILELSITENPLLFLIGSCGPIFSAVIITGIAIGQSGIRELLSGWLNWRFDFKWYLVALSPLVLGFITVGIYHLLGGQSPEAESYPTVSFILLTLLFAFLVGPLGEETGWRGFALPRLQTRFSAFTSTLILGIIWSAWHIPLWFVPDSPQTEVPFGAFIIMCVSFSFLLTWAYNNSKGSILIAVLLHWCFNFTGSLIMPLGLIPPDIYFYTVAALYLVYAIVVIVVFGPTKLSRKPDFEMPFVREK